MTPAQRQRVHTLFDEAAALPEGEQLAYLHQYADDDHEVLEEVKRLLGHDDGESSFGAEPLVGPDAVAGALQAEVEPLLRSLTPGREIGAYRIVRILATGGMGVVCEAEDLALPGHRHVALKILKDAATGSAQRRERFLREAAAAGRLEHPSIARVYATGNDGPLHFLAMELVDGPSLADLVHWRRGGCVGDRDRHGHLVPDADGWRDKPIEKACRVALAVARALATTHEHQILHRDVKPSNILLRPENGEPVLTDFGLARTDGDSKLTQTGDFLGTPYYVSPEQARGRDVDARTDVYSLGATLFELLALEVPFPEASTAEVLAKVVAKEQAPGLRTLMGPVSRDLEKVVATALEKDSERRYAGAAHLGDDLDRFLRFRPVAARPLGPLTQLWRWAKTHKAIATSVVLTLLLLSTGTVAAFVFRQANARSAFATAEASAKRGAWKEALQRYAEARTSGYSDDVAIAIGRIEAWQGLAETNLSLDELARLERRSDVGPHRAKLLLLRGLIGHNRFVDPDAGVPEIAAALAIDDHPLSPADAEFARSYLATSLVDVKIHLEGALRLDPAHHGALANLVATLFLLGKTDELESRLEAYRTLAPENPNALATIILVRALSGAYAESRSTLADATPDLPDQVVDSLGVTITTIERIHNIISTRTLFFEGSRLKGALRSLESGFTQLLPTALPLVRLLDRETTEKGDLEISLPPAVARLVQRVVRSLPRYLVADDEEKIQTLDDLIELEPLSVFYMMRGHVHYGRGDYRDAESDYHMGLFSPGPTFIETELLCLAGELSSQTWQSQTLKAADLSIPERLRDRMSQTLRRFAKRGDRSAANWQSIFAEARAHARAADALKIALAWRGEHPEDPEALAAVREALAALDE